MTGITRYAMRDARLRESRKNEARILLHDEIQGYKDRIKALEDEIASLKAEKRPVEASPKDAPISTPEAKEAPTQPSKSTRKGGKK